MRQFLDCVRDAAQTDAVSQCFARGLGAESFVTLATNAGLGNGGQAPASSSPAYTLPSHDLARMVQPNLIAFDLGFEKLKERLQLAHKAFERFERHVANLEDWRLTPAVWKLMLPSGSSPVTMFPSGWSEPPITFDLGFEQLRERLLLQGWRPVPTDWELLLPSGPSPVMVLPSEEPEPPSQGTCSVQPDGLPGSPVSLDELVAGPKPWFHTPYIAGPLRVGVLQTPLVPPVAVRVTRSRSLAAFEEKLEQPAGSGWALWHDGARTTDTVKTPPQFLSGGPVHHLPLRRPPALRRATF